KASPHVRYASNSDQGGDSQRSAALYHERTPAVQQTTCTGCTAFYDGLAVTAGHAPFAYRRYGIFRRGRVGQSALLLASRLSLPHFSVSSAISRPNSPEFIDLG